MFELSYMSLRVNLYWPGERLTKCTWSGLPLALCWSVYWPLKNLQVELFPLQIPQASRETLEPKMWSHPTACTHRETHVTLNWIKIVTVLTKTKKHQLKFPPHSLKLKTRPRRNQSITITKVITFWHDSTYGYFSNLSQMYQCGKIQDIQKIKWEKNLKCTHGNAFLSLQISMMYIVLFHSL